MYRYTRHTEKLLVSKEAFKAAQLILDIEEDVKKSYGDETEHSDAERETLAGMVAYALDHYRTKIRLFGWAIDSRVLRHAQTLVEEGRESDEIEKIQRQELLVCRSSFWAARDAVIAHLGSYLAKLRRHNEIWLELENPVDKHVLAAVMAIYKWADGDHEKVATDRFLRSENLRNWGYAGYTAKIASIYYWALRKTNEDVDGEVLAAVNEVLEMAQGIGQTEE
ncbi:hypothetical protein ONS95_009601 [Cadophora gregata]|uniref:uncharacterized protein n=1 Tax=Cadophora gregata TaxID=51156 RepID=UPI0026DD197B|nr:uncharacterized protein ONS95_009601 [Cadophora gregata]KAK0124655.1 hypothetical protein ONS95_009601 [Cadophora gregata]KAK0129485.1 hypothetical protein ONS96_000054 [Cadophora gregata f. sp. sojae]